jgi:hypothetical protein
MVAKDTLINRLQEEPTLPGDDRTIWEIITALSAELSDDEWREQPSDGSINYRHYLYEQPQRQYPAAETILRDEAA